MAALTLLFLGSISLPVLSQSLAHADPICTVSAILVNSCRPWLGAAAFNYPEALSNTPAQIAYHEQRLSNAYNGTNNSRQLDIIHTYHSPGQNTLSANDVAFATRPGTILYTNWKLTETWNNIATQNAAIDSMANSIKSLGHTKIFLTLYHEPEDNVSPGGDPNCTTTQYKGSAGTVADYRNMWAYTENRFKNVDGVDNVVWVMNYMGFANWDCLVPDLYPGDQYVDWITFDPYGANIVSKYADTVGRFYNDVLTAKSSNVPDPVTGLTHNFTSKQWGLGEWGATNNTADETKFFDDAKIALDNGTYPLLKMYLIFDERSGQSPTGTNRRVGYNDDGSLNTDNGKHYYNFANDPNIMGSWDTTLPTVPGGLAASSASASQVNLSWTASTNNISVTGYDIYRNGTKIATTPGVTYADTGLTDGTTYQYAVVAFDAAGNTSAQSAVVTATTTDGTAPSAPAGVVATAVNAGEVDLTWQASTDNVGVTGYQVYRDGALQPTPPGGVTTTSYQDTTTAAETTYSYTVVAFDAAGNQGVASAAAMVTTPSLPTPPDTTAPTTPQQATAIAASSHEVDLTWQASSDATGVVGYNIFRDGQQVGTVAGVSTAYVDTTVAESTDYSYTVVAYDAAGNNSTASDAALVTTPATLPPSDTTAPTVPGNLATTVVGPTEVDLTWDASTDEVGVTGYQVYRDGTLLITLGNVTSYQDTALTPQTAYSYTVLALDAAGNTSAQSQSSGATTPAAPDVTPPAAPVGLAATVISGSEIDLSWQPTTDNVAVTGYKLYRSGVDNVNVLVATTAANVTTYADTGLADGSAYTYTIVAFDAVGNTSTPSSAVNASTPDVTPPAVPTGLTPTVLSGTSVQLDWQASADATSYNIYRDGAFLVAVTTGTSYTNTGLVSGATYQYAVAAVDAAANASAKSDVMSATTLDTVAPDVPATPTATVSGTSITVSWQTPNDNVGTTGYKLYRNGALVNPALTGTSYTDTGLAVGASYSYTVVAFDAAGNLGGPSAASASVTILDTMPPSAPSNVVSVAQSNGTSVNITWNAASDNVGVTGYQIYRGTTFVTTVASGTSYLDTGLANGTTYSYKVYAIDAAGNQSAGSNTASTTTLTPDTTAPMAVVLTAGAASPTQVNLSWTASSDNIAVTGYRVYRGATLIATVTDITYQDSGLTPSVAYSYKVYAIDAAGNQSVVSNIVSVATPPNKPINFKVASVTATSETLTWSAPTYSVGIVSYQILRKNVVVATVSGSTFTFTDTGLTPLTSYTYHINAIDSLGSLSAQATAPTLSTAADTTPPSTPGGFTAVTGTVTKTVNLSWAACTDDVGVTGYRIYRGSTLVTTVSGTTLSYTDTAPTSGVTYNYHIVAIDAAGNASASSVTLSAKAK